MWPAAAKLQEMFLGLCRDMVGGASMQWAWTRWAKIRAKAPGGCTGRRWPEARGLEGLCRAGP